MTDNQDLHDLFTRIFDVLRAHQESLFKSNLAIHAAVEALKEQDAEFAESYERHFWEAKQGQLGEENAIAARVIEAIRQQLKHDTARAQGAD
ncbi:MAG TPA: hypothetical protein VFU76_17650 [Terriglobales bacterium]|nr:hypothetical protein [Terriglobales bacterium]